MKFLRENKNLMKAILVLAIPAIFENVLQFFIGVVDMYFVGSLGKEAISAVGGIGIAGAALATTISRFVAVTILLVVLCRRFEIHKKFKVTLDRGVQKSLLKIGGPAAVEKLVMRVGQILYGALIINIGTTAYAAHNIGGTIENLTYLPCLGFGIAAATLVGQKLGANKPDEAVKVGILSFIMSTALIWTIALVFLIFPEQLAAIFGIWLGMGLVGVWLSYALDITLRSIILMRRYIKKKWLNIEVNIKA